MKLRKQLVLVSLLTLALPWAGCQYVREMEGTLREGQSRALLATAEAVANRIASEPLLLAELTQNFAGIAPDAQLYAHPLNAPIILDGYDDEWRHLQFSGKQWQAGDFRLQVQAAHYNNRVFLFIQVDDNELNYYHPGQRDYTRSDHLILRTLDRDGRLRDFVLVASAPGIINAYDINSPHHDFLLRAELDNDSDLLFLTQRRQEHAIKGIWQERKGGYQVELELPWYITQGYLGIAAVNATATASPEWLGSITAHNAPAPLVRHSQELGATLAVFAKDDLRLRIATNNQWMIAEAGSLQNSGAVLPEPTWITRLMRNAFTRKNFPPLDRPERDGRLDTEEISQALGNENAAQWYRNQQQVVARAAAPIRSNQQVVGAVVAEQTSASVLALTDSAFRRLVFYTVFATGLAGLGLVAYASWLSLRIRRLSQAADSAIREDGNLHDGNLNSAFTPSSARDELGDLSRSYKQLLNRVQEYTDYLRTLSNKLSHELRTPLAVVRSSLDNLEAEVISDNAKIYAHRAQEGSQRLSAILNAISSASRVEESILHADMTPFPLDKIVTELALAYQDIASQKIICSIASGQNYSLYGSADLIVQMIDKLFDNACDFCPAQGTITFTVTRSKNIITLTVDNDGPLLPQKMQRQIFDSLVSMRASAENTTSDGKIHLGLGLHIVRLIAELHHAQVSAHNRSDNSGVTIVVQFEAN